MADVTGCSSGPKALDDGKEADTEELKRRRPPRPWEHGAPVSGRGGVTAAGLPETLGFYRLEDAVRRGETRRGGDQGTGMW
ncbi:hypothetical protein NHX12_011123 [Muraenolepis orangiensis]|uniref:Uncharacterized protein n=1 Tax=Muraenolepis orangiensis TaxID=630683 RepID=A0A9Q0DFQ7_9TELE|nr:hypothetical protein NHX12_011123 [Muraenolepis orangiensis]